MRKLILAGFAASTMLIPSLALAQTPIEDGARAGGTVGGPAGAIVGGAVGAAVQIPAEVLGFVGGVRGPSVRVEEHVVVGEPLPRTVELHTIPSHREYSYAIVNERRVIVEPRTRRIVRIIE